MQQGQSIDRGHLQPRPGDLHQRRGDHQFGGHALQVPGQLANLLPAPVRVRGHRHHPVVPLPHHVRDLGQLAQHRNAPDLVHPTLGATRYADPGDHPSVAPLLAGAIDEVGDLVDTARHQHLVHAVGASPLGQQTAAQGVPKERESQSGARQDTEDPRTEIPHLERQRRQAQRHHGEHDRSEEPAELLGTLAEDARLPHPTGDHAGGQDATGDPGDEARQPPGEAGVAEDQPDPEGHRDDDHISKHDETAVGDLPPYG